MKGLKFSPLLPMILAFLLAAAGAPCASIGQEGVDAQRLEVLVKRLDGRYKGLKALEAEFLQRTIQPGGAVVEARGRVHLQPPAMMRWEYKAPEKQLIVTDGGRIYVYEPDERQVMVMGKEGVLSSAISRAFFWGQEGVEKGFRVLPVCRGRGEVCSKSSFAAGADPARSLLLIPRSRETAQGIAAMVVELEGKSGAVRRMWIENEMGTVTFLAFSHMVWNRPRPPEFFRFRIPQGVTVYGEGGAAMDTQENEPK